MANTIPLLSYANTFGDWIITTNELVQTNNDFVSNTFHKSTGTLFLDDPVLGLQVGNQIVAGRIQVQGIGSSAYVQNTLQVDGTMYANNFTVNNTFTLTGSTVFNSNNFTLNANNTVGANATISVNRATSGTNASIRWNESAQYWDVLDVTNSNYYRILTNENIVDNVLSTSNTSVASANVAYNLNNYIQSTNSLAQSAFNKANTSTDSFARNTANSAFVQANTATNNAASASLYANTGITIAQAAFNKANTGGGGGIQPNSDATLNSIGVGSGVSAPGNGGISFNGNLNLTGSSQRIYGSFAVTPHANRILFQDPNPSAVITPIGIIGPPCAQNVQEGGRLLVYGNSDPDNSAVTLFGCDPLVGTSFLNATYRGSVTSGLPLTFGVAPAGEAARIVPSSLNFLIGKSNDDGNKLQVNGTISASGFNNTSDYRLKENVQPITDALVKITQLNPVTFNWKKDGSSGEGFIAHELQEVLPIAVTGNKDQTNSFGKPIYQQIDKTTLIATMTAAIQELNAKVVELESKLKSAGIDGF